MAGGPTDYKTISPEEMWQKNKGDNPPYTLADLKEAANRPRRLCENCATMEWKVGSLIVGWTGCFSCITGEADASDDYDLP